jgi:hypothetical protein
MGRVARWCSVGTAAIVGLFLTLVLLLQHDLVRAPTIDGTVIEHAVARHPPLLDKAFSLPSASRYGRTIYYQTHSSFCGPASLVNVFRSVGDNIVDERAMLAGTGKCGLGFCWLGLTLDEVAEIARSHGRQRVTILRDLSPDSFREHLRQSNDPHFRYIINFARARIFGSGGGHHSPIGGYLETDDKVLVLDVNRNFGPWVIDRERLYQAMNTLDGSTKRGLLMLESRVRP